MPSSRPPASLDSSIEKEAVDVSPAQAVLSADEAALRQLGYKQELRRTFTPLELFGVGRLSAILSSQALVDRASHLRF